MAVVKVQSVTGNGATIVLNGVAAGNALFLQTGYYRAIATGVAEAVPTDSNGTFLVAQAPSPVNFGGVNDIGASIFSSVNVAAGTHTVTPQANTAHQQCLSEFSGLVTTTLLDVGANNSSTVQHTSLATGTTGTTAQADELVLIGHSMGASAGSTDVGYTDPVSGFTTLFKQPDDATSVAVLQAYKVVASVGTQTATFNWTASEVSMVSQAVIATFKAAAGGGPTRAPHLLLLGVGLVRCLAVLRLRESLSRRSLGKTLAAVCFPWRTP